MTATKRNKPAPRTRRVKPQFIERVWVPVLVSESQTSPPSEPAERIYQCDQCTFKGSRSKLEPLADVFQRVAPGELMPAGQCPKCKAAISALDEEVHVTTLSVCLRIAAERIEAQQSALWRAAQAKESA